MNDISKIFVSPTISLLIKEKRYSTFCILRILKKTGFLRMTFFVFKPKKPCLLIGDLSIPLLDLMFLTL